MSWLAEANALGAMHVLASSVTVAVMVIIRSHAAGTTEPYWRDFFTVVVRH